MSSSEGYRMGLNRPEQELKRDLQGVASDLKWSAVELMRIAERLSQSGNESDAQAVLKMCSVFNAAEDKLAALVEDVKDERIVRVQAE